MEIDIVTLDLVVTTWGGGAGGGVLQGTAMARGYIRLHWPQEMRVLAESVLS